MKKILSYSIIGILFLITNSIMAQTRYTTDTLKTQYIKGKSGHIINISDTLKFPDGTKIISGKNVFLDDSSKIKTDIRNLTTKVNSKQDSLGRPSVNRYILHGKTNGTKYWDQNEYLRDSSSLYSLIDTTGEWASRTIYCSYYTGNDTTGNGSISTPYRSLLKGLKNIKSSIRGTAIITLHLDSGYYSYDDDCYTVLSKINIYSSSTEPFTIEGTTTKYSTYTLTADANDFTKYTSSTSLTANSLKGYFLSSSSPTSSFTYVPIKSNTSTSIYSPLPTTAYNTVYKLKTNLIIKEGITSSVYSNLFSFNSISPGTIYIKFYKLNMSFNLSLSGGGVFYLNNVYYSGCYINMSNWSTLQFRILNSNYVYFWGVYLTRYVTAANKTIIKSESPNCMFYSSIIENSALTKIGVGIWAKRFNGKKLWLSNFTYGISVIGDGDISPSLSIGSIKATTENLITTWTNSTTFSSKYDINLDKVVLDTTMSLFYGYTTNPIYFSINSITTNSNSYSVFNTSSLIKSFINLSKGYSILIPNTYPEIQQNNSYTLADNSTDSISIADLSYNRTIELSYNITRNSVIRTGRIKITNTGSSYTIDKDEYSEPSDIGVTFNGVYKSGTSNILKLKYTTTSTGYSGTMVYDAYRQNF
jgi:hypothetical protein